MILLGKKGVGGCELYCSTRQARAAHHLTKVTKARDAARITREFTQLTDEEDDSGMGRRFKAMCFSTTDTKHNLVPPCPW